MKQKVPVKISLVTELYGAGDSAMKAIDNVTLQTFDNEFLTLLGPSSCGKTTLLSMIALFEDITSGWIKLFDDELDGIRKTFFGHSFSQTRQGDYERKQVINWAWHLRILILPRCVLSEQAGARSVTAERIFMTSFLAFMDNVFPALVTHRAPNR